MSQPFDIIEHVFYPGEEQIKGDPFGLGVLVGAFSAAVAGVDDSVTDADVCDALLAIEGLRRCLDTASLELLAEADLRGSTDVDHGMRTGPWLAYQAHLPSGACRSRVKVANKIHGQLSEVLDALRAGRIGWDHAKVLCDAANPRIISDFAALVPGLVDLVELMTFDVWARNVRAAAELLDSDGGHRPGDDITDNRLSISGFFDNTVVIDGQLTGEIGLIVKEAIETRADRLFHRMVRDHETCDELPVPPRKTLLALALAELIREALTNGTTKGSAPKAEISLIINAEDPESVTDRTGVPIGDSDRYACLCDPVFKPVIMNTSGVVLDLGRTQRLASDEQRKAMAHRDGGCVFPGCENPPEWTDAHHSIHWNKGGPTDLALLASLCRHHHMVTHRKNWIMTATPNQWFTWTTPAGQTLWSQRHGQRCPPHQRITPAGTDPPDSG